MQYIHVHYVLNTVRKLIEMFWLKKAYVGPQRTGIRVKHRGVRFHRIRDLRQYYVSSIIVYNVFCCYALLILYVLCHYHHYHYYPYLLLIFFVIVRFQQHSANLSISPWTRSNS